MNAYTEKSNLLAKQRFYEEMAPNDLSRAFYIHKSGSVIGWRIVRQGGAVLSYDAGNRSFAPFDVLPEDKAVNLVPYDYIGGKISEVNGGVRTAGERPESFYLGLAKVLQTPDGLMCQPHGMSDYVPLRTDIRDIKEGDAFVAGPINAWSRSRVCIASYDAHQNLDEPDEPWIVHDDKLNSWFEEDICTDLYTLESFMTPEHHFRKELGNVTGAIDDLSKIRNNGEISFTAAAVLDKDISELSTKRGVLECRLNEVTAGHLHETLLPISRKVVDFINKVLDMDADEIYDAYGIKRDEKLSYTVAFNSGYQMDINVIFCDDSSPHVDLVLYDKDGHELSCAVHEDYIDQDMVLTFSDAKDPSEPFETHIFYVHPNVMEQAQEKGMKKPPLADQIRQAETRTAPANAEKGPRNIHKDR